MNHKQIVTHDMLRGAAMVAWHVIGTEGLAKVIGRHCPDGGTVSVGRVADRAACFAGLVEAVELTAQGSFTASTQARSRSSDGPP